MCVCIYIYLYFYFYFFQFFCECVQNLNYQFCDMFHFLFSLVILAFGIGNTQKKLCVKILNSYVARCSKCFKNQMVNCNA
jgi:hypothetical protein